MITMFSPVYADASTTFIQTLVYGSRGDEVTQLQEFLAQDSFLYPGGEVTGFYGILTTKAVKRFQIRHGLGSVGVVGPKTRSKLNELISNNEATIDDGASINTEVFVSVSKNETQKRLEALEKQNDSLFRMISMTNKIDSLSNITLNSATISGISGLTDADIPNSITASNYLPLSGGVLTGMFISTDSIGIGTTSPYAKLSVVGEVVAEYFTATSTTAISTFAGSVGIGTTKPYSKLSLGTDVSTKFAIYEQVSGNYFYGIGMAQGSDYGLGLWGGTEGSTPSDSNTHMFIARNTGNVGIGTESPLELLHVYSGDARFEPTAGEYLDIEANTNEIEISTETTSHLRFHSGGNIISDLHNNTNNFDVVVDGGSPLLRVGGTGNVGIGTSTPAFPLDVYSTVSSNQSYGFLNSSGNIGTASGSSDYSIRAEGRILAPEFNAVSDARLKDEQFDIDSRLALDLISSLRPVSFTWKSNPDGQPILGFIAQDVEVLIPNAVSKLNTKNFPDQRQLDYNQIITIAVGAIKELNGILEKTTSTITVWLGDATNGIEAVFADTFYAKEKICVDGECLTKDDIRKILEITNGQIAPLIPIQ